MKNHLIYLLTCLVFAVFAAGCASTKNPGEEGGKATTTNFLLRHGLTATLYNIEFRGPKSVVVAAEERGKDKIGQSSELFGVVMSDFNKTGFNKMKQCYLHFPGWFITWVFNDDGTCTILENNRDNPGKNGYAIPVQGPTLEWPPDLTEGLVAHYLLNGNAKDESSHGLHGTLEGALPTPNRDGVDGAALQFKESGQLIKVPHTDVLNIAGGLTISVWLRPIRLRENDLSILAKRSGDDNRYDFQLSLSGFTRLRYAWSHRTNQVVALSNDVLPVNRWFQIAVVHKSGKSLAFYVNGEEVEYKLTTPDRFLPTTELTRGVHGRRLRIGHNYSGAMDDLRIYNRALTAEEIKSLFDMEKPKTK